MIEATDIMTALNFDSNHTKTFTDFERMALHKEISNQLNKRKSVLDPALKFKAIDLINSLK